MFRFRSRENPTPPAAGACYRAAEHVAAARHGDRTVLLDHQGDSYYSLDEIGTRIWEMVEDGATVEHVVHALSTEYDAPGEVLHRDTERLLGELAGLRLVTVR